MTDTKAYELPNLPLAAQSNLQLLVLRLIEYADLSAIPAIADELMEQRRDNDLDRLRNTFGEYASRCRSGGNDYGPIRWRWVGDSLVHLFWVDLFGWGGVVTALTGNIRTADEVYETAHMAMPATDTLVYQATQDISAGSYVRLEYNPATVRLATPEEMPTPAEEGPE